MDTPGRGRCSAQTRGHYPPQGSAKPSPGDSSLAPAREEVVVKLVIGIVRPEKANDVLEALYRAEVRGLSMSRVQGHKRARPRRDLPRHDRQGRPRREGPVRDRGLRSLRRADDRRAPRGRTYRGGGRRQDLRRALERAVRIRTGETDVGAVTPVASDRPPDPGGSREGRHGRHGDAGGDRARAADDPLRWGSSTRGWCGRRPAQLMCVGDRGRRGHLGAADRLLTAFDGDAPLISPTTSASTT